MTETELIEKCIKRDRSAQKYLFKKYSAILLGLCVRYATDRNEAEDILQDGFLKILLNIADYNGSGSFEGWMKRVVINTAITHYHKNLKYRYHYDVDEMYDLPGDEIEFGSADFTLEELLKVINELPQGYKMVFNLYAIEGYKHKEIAEMLEIDINTSKSQFSRARKHIQKKLEELRLIKYDK